MQNLTQHSGSCRLCIRSIRALGNGERMEVAVSMEQGEHREDRRFPLTAGQYYELNLKKGEISEETFDAIERASRLTGAIRQGENLLSFGANSALALTRKIMRHGYTQSEASDAVAYLVSLGLIDEWGDLSREVEKCLRKHWGAERIRAHLWSRGYDRDTMERLPELLDGIDFPSHAAALLQKQYGGLPESREERNRVTAALYRYGYRLDEIKEAFKRLQ